MAPRVQVTESEQRARRKLWRRAQELTPFIAAERGSSVFLVPTRADDRFFKSKGRKEFVVLDRVVALLRDAGRTVEGTAFVDVGAHIGTTTIVALAEYGFTSAVAIEPDPANVRLLRANLALNGMEARIAVVAAAIAATPGTASFELASPDERGDAYWTKGRVAEDGSGETIEVETVTLDGLARDGVVDPAATGLLWLDCQKHELDALAAASTFLERRVPIVFAFRPRTLTPEDPMAATLAATYSTFVNLRPTRAGTHWAPRLRPIAELATFSGRRKALTDVLLVPEG